MNRYHLSHKYIKEEEEEKRGILVKETIRTETDQTIGQIVEIEDSLETDPGLSRITEEAIFEVTLGDIVDKIAEGNIETIAIDIMIKNRGRDRPRKKPFSGSYSGNRARSTSSSRFRSGSRASTNRYRLQCYNCREHDHFVWDCPTSREERDLEQLQHMLNSEEEEQTYLSSSRQSSPIGGPRTGPLNL